MELQPSLFGITHSNRDFTLSETWGKNQFNSSFPASLASFMSHLGMDNVFLVLDENLRVCHSKISTEKLYGINPSSDNLLYSFESQFTPFQSLVIGHFPRVDLVTSLFDSGDPLKGLEVKLTALPDNSTCGLSEDKFGCELVIRPDTIVYLACSIASLYRNETQRLQAIFGDEFEGITDWTEGVDVLPYLMKMIDVLDKIALDKLDFQEPLIMQPVWKTEGKSPILCNNCLDVFIWSNLAFTQLFLDVARGELTDGLKITRQIRTIIWLFKMIYDFSKNGQFNHQKVIDELTYNTKNDKAFAVSGRVTWAYMSSEELSKPRVEKSQIKDIILGGGQNLLSPERRFDAIIFNSPDLFK